MSAIGEIKIIRDFQVNLDQSEFARLLGAGRNGISKPRIVSHLERVLTLAEDLIHSSGIYGIWPTNDVTHLDLPQKWVRDSCFVALCAVTIGSEVTTKTTSLKQEQSLSDAVILDAYSSAMAEAAAEAMDAVIREDIAKLGLKTRGRRSPGYGLWKLNCQVLLLEMLGAEEVGITANDSMLMSPEKSVSFAIPIINASEETPTGDTLDKCTECDFSNCSFRSKSGENK